jgi:drug/metabolite transporter (DMT)-like permease
VFGETVGWRRWSAIIAGLLGVLIVLRPFGDGFQLAALFAVMGVMAQTGRDLATRRISKDISTQQLSGLGFLALAPAGIVALLVTGDGIVWPDGHAWLLLIGAIGIGLPALYAIIAAVRIGDISFIAPFRYTRIVFGLAAGALVFHETLDGYTVLGATVIVASGLYMLLREAQLRRASKRYATAL